MGELVNLNRVRKRAAREQAESDARANRAKFGRSKAERVVEKARAGRDGTLLDQHRIEREDEP